MQTFHYDYFWDVDLLFSGRINIGIFNFEKDRFTYRRKIRTVLDSYHIPDAVMTTASRLPGII